MRLKPRTLSSEQIKAAKVVVDSFLDVMLGLKSHLPTEYQSTFDEGIDIFQTLMKLLFYDAEPAKDSSNSHEPPSNDKNRPKKPPAKRERNIGGQKGHKGTVIELFENPDERNDITPNKEKYERDPNWRKVKTIKRQVVDIELSRKIIEYYTDVYENIVTGERVSGKFPKGIEAPLQYGLTLQSLVTQLKEQQHLSYERIAEFINSNFDLSVAESTLVNIIKKAENSPVLDDFMKAAENDILDSQCINADETSIKINGINHWVHLLANSAFTLFYCHEKRGKDGMDGMGLLGRYTGIVVHDHWTPYFKYEVTHSLCNAHIIRELKLAVEMDQKWAANMSELLLNCNKLVKCHGGVLPLALQKRTIKEYRKIINTGIMATGGECLARPPGQKGKRGRIRKPKYRNLLERLKEFEGAVLRFMVNKLVPFTNNNAERPVRMVKVHMKTSGSFCGINFAQGFCRMRGYLVSCKKNGINSSEATNMLINGEVPEFIKERLARGTTGEN